MGYISGSNWRSDIGEIPGNLLVTLATETPTSGWWGNIKTEVATSCSRGVGRILVKTGRHQPTHKTFNPKFVLPARCMRIKDGKEIEGTASQLLAELKTYPMQVSQSLTLLMILFSVPDRNLA
jgi:hypothetical protein